MQPQLFPYRWVTYQLNLWEKDHLLLFLFSCEPSTTKISSLEKNQLGILFLILELKKLKRGQTKYIIARPIEEAIQSIGSRGLKYILIVGNLISFSSKKEKLLAWKNTYDKRKDSLLEEYLDYPEYPHTKDTRCP